MSDHSIFCSLQRPAAVNEAARSWAVEAAVLRDEEMNENGLILRAGRDACERAIVCPHA